jgi:hypothetical protein
LLFYNFSFAKAKQRHDMSSKEKFTPDIAAAMGAGVWVSVKKYNIMKGYPHL